MSVLVLVFLMTFSKSKCKGSVQVCWVRSIFSTDCAEFFGSNHAEKDVEVLMDQKLDARPAVCAGSPESHPYPRLHQEQCGQHGKGEEM